MNTIVTVEIKRPWAVYVNGILAIRTQTYGKARKLAGLKFGTKQVEIKWEKLS